MLWIVVRYLKCWNPHTNMKISKDTMPLKNLFFKME